MMSDSINPVVAKWMENKVLMTRGGSGTLALIAGQTLSRADVVANSEVIGPVLQEYGTRLSVDILEYIVDQFFSLARPRGKKPIDRSFAVQQIEDFYWLLETVCVILNRFLMLEVG